MTPLRALTVRLRKASQDRREDAWDAQIRQACEQAARDARVILAEQIAKAILDDARIGKPRQVAGSEKVAAYWDGTTEQAIRDAEKARKIGRQKP